MTAEIIAGISFLVSLIVAIVGWLLKSQHDDALRRITELEARMNHHHDDKHAQLERDIGALQGKSRCTRDDR